MKKLHKYVAERDKSLEELRETLIQEGRNQVLYLLLCIGDENIIYDNWHPDRADFLVDVRRKILRELRHRDDLPTDHQWPRQWPDFEAYCSGSDNASG